MWQSDALPLMNAASLAISKISLVGHPSRLRRLDITFQARQTVHSECGAEADEFGYPIPKRDNCLLVRQSHVVGTLGPREMSDLSPQK